MQVTATGKRTDLGTDCRQQPAVMMSKKANRDANAWSLGLVCIAGYVC